MADFVISGMGELDKALEKLEKSSGHKVNSFAAQMGENLIGRAANLTPVDTGRLKGAWARTRPAEGRVTVYNNTEYAAHVEWGHRIFVKKNGKWVPTKRKTKGRHMLRDAVKELEADFEADAFAILEGLLT